MLSYQNQTGFQQGAECFSIALAISPQTALPISHSCFIHKKNPECLISLDCISKYYANSLQTTCKMPSIHQQNRYSFHPYLKLVVGL